MTSALRQHIIYGLFDPRDGELRYIGKSEAGLKRRLAEHLMPSYLATPSHKNSWIKGLLAEGVQPVGVVLQRLSTSAELCDAERYWITFFRAQGCRLTNMTDGGEGFGKRPVSAETRAKMRAAKLGKKQSPEHIAKRIAPRIGRPLSAEHRASCSAAAKRRGISAATRAAAIAAATGRVRTEAERAATSERMTRWWADPNNRSRMLAARGGK